MQAVPSTEAFVPPIQGVSLKRNFIWILAGDLIYNGCQWAMLAVLAKMGTLQMVGQYTLALAIMAPLVLFTSLGLRSVQATDAGNQFSFRDYAALRLLMLVVFVCAMIIILSTIGFDTETKRVIAFIALVKLMDLLSDLIYGMFLKRERVNYISISRIMQGVLQIAVLAGVIYLGGNIVLATAAVAMASALVTVAYDLPMAVKTLEEGSSRGLAQQQRRIFPLKVASFQFNKEAVLTLFKISLPLGIGSILAVLNGHIPRYFLSFYIGVSEVGMFAAMWSILYPTGMVLGAVMQVIMPRASRYFVEDLRKYKALMKLALAVALLTGLLGVACAYFWGAKLLTMLFRPEYGAHSTVFVWVMTAGGIYYVATILNDFLAAARWFLPQPIICGSSALVGTALCFWLVPSYGLLGAAWSYLGACLVWFAGGSVATAIILHRSNRRPLKP